MRDIIFETDYRDGIIAQEHSDNPVLIILISEATSTQECVRCFKFGMQQDAIVCLYIR